MARVGIYPVLLVVSLLAAPLFWVADARGQGASCSRGDFVAVVDEAASILQSLNQTNKVTFQERLRALKAKNNWAQDEYLKGAEPYVRDEKIVGYDQLSSKLLSDIAALGQEGSESATPDCAVLLQLRGQMDVLVKAQKDKWAYMFEKIDAALGQ